MMSPEPRSTTRRVPIELTPRVALLVGGAIVLLLASLAIVIWGVRRPTTPAVAAAPTPTMIVPVVAAAEPTATALAPPTATVPSMATATPRPPTATVRPSAAPTARPSATAARPIVSHGGCAVALPVGFGEETPQGGYYPALDRSGFAALDAFDTANGRRTPEELAQDFAATTLNRVIQGYRMTGAEPTGGGYRIDYVATVAGQPGRGSFYLKDFGPLACGATMFVLDASGVSLASAFDLMVLSLTAAPTTR